MQATLENQSHVAIVWLNQDEMIANPSKFQLIFLSKEKGHLNSSISIGGHQIESKNSVELLGITIDDKLKFDKHVSKLCKSAVNQCYSLYRFRKYMSPFVRKIAANSYIYSAFSYCPLVWHFCPGILNI